MTYRMLRYRFDKIRAKAGINFDDFNFMDLKVKAGTNKEDNSGIEAAKDQLGYTTPSTTVKYIRHQQGKKVNPLNKK